MAFDNRLNRALARLDALPNGLRNWARSKIIGRAIPFVGTADIEIARLDDTECELILDNRRKVQNHIHGIHAAAVALLAETASGLVVGMNVPDERLPLLKRMAINYTQRARGGLSAVARLTTEQIRAIRATDRGEVNVAVSVHDQDNTVPAACEMLWVWIPKDGKQGGG